VSKATIIKTVRIAHLVQMDIEAWETIKRWLREHGVDVDERIDTPRRRRRFGSGMHMAPNDRAALLALIDEAAAALYPNKLEEKP